KLESDARNVRPDLDLDVVKDDPDDNRVLECAWAGRADYVVSGDRHLLGLASYEGIPIITVRRFLEEAEIES
ncbi:MAG: putative toxin-antitoxin system toxin component, PIN family, partial [Terriglobia bacterium]